MKIKVDKLEFLNALRVSSAAASQKATIAILSSTLLRTTDTCLKVCATDLDLGIVYEVKADIIEAGAIAAPTDRLISIIDSLPNGEVEITTTKNNTVMIHTNVCDFRISSYSSDDFPKMPEFEYSTVITLKQRDLANLIDMTSFAISREETRYIFNGSLFKIKDNILTIVATDAKRLALVKHTLSNSVAEEVAAIIPLKAILEIRSNVSTETDEDVSLSFNKNMVLISFKKMSMISRLTEGTYPEYQHIIPEVSETRMSINRMALLSASIRASLLVTTEHQSVKFEVYKDKVIVSKVTPDIGDLKAEISESITYNGSDMSIGFQPAYVIELLKNIQNDTIVFELTAPERPVVLRLPNYVHVLLPMRLN